jgi:hypothetical protein
MCTAIFQMLCVVKFPVYFSVSICVRAAFPMPWAGRKFLVGQHLFAATAPRWSGQKEACWRSRQPSGGFRRPTLFGRFLRQTGWLQRDFMLSILHVSNVIKKAVMHARIRQL